MLLRPPPSSFLPVPLFGVPHLNHTTSIQSYLFSVIRFLVTQKSVYCISFWTIKSFHCFIGSGLWTFCCTLPMKLYHEYRRDRHINSFVLILVLLYSSRLCPVRLHTRLLELFCLYLIACPISFAHILNRLLFFVFLSLLFISCLFNSFYGFVQ